MDEQLRILLGNVVDNQDQDGGQNLLDAYTKLKRNQESFDQPNPFGEEIYIICAETALQVNCYEIASMKYNPRRVILD